MKQTKIIPYILTESNGIKLETYSKEKYKKCSNSWGFNNTFWMINGSLKKLGKKVKKLIDSSEN
jgi:hypothetical protein